VKYINDSMCLCKTDCLSIIINGLIYRHVIAAYALDAHYERPRGINNFLKNNVIITFSNLFILLLTI
jgi:hypothetical protein